MEPTKVIEVISINKDDVSELNDYIEDKRDKIIKSTLIPSTLITPKTTTEKSTITSTTKITPTKINKPLPFNSEERLAQEIEYFKNLNPIMSKNIRFDYDYLKEKLPGRPHFYYREAVDILSNIEYFDSNNYKKELEKFSYVDSIRSAMSSYTTELVNTSIDGSTIHDHILSLINDSSYQFFGIKRTKKLDLLLTFNKLNVLVKDSSTSINDLLLKVGDIEWRMNKSISRFLFFKDFMGLIIQEIDSRGIITKDELQSSLLVNRYNNFVTNSLVIEQAKASLEIIRANCKLALQSFDDYINVLKPSLDLLLINDKKEFEKVFENYINIISK